MKQIVHLNEQTKHEIVKMEHKCEKIGKRLSKRHEKAFLTLGETIIIEFIREKKGKPAVQEDLFSDGYESYLEIGVEKEGLYFPNGHLPIWKCKQEMFHHVGKLINLSTEAIENKLEKMITEIYEDHRSELKEK